MQMSARVKAQTEYCLAMKPEETVSVSTCELRKSLSKLISQKDDSKQIKLRSGGNIAIGDKKKLDCTFQDLASDLNRINKNFENLIECFYKILDEVDKISDVMFRLGKLEQKVAEVQQNIVKPNNAAPKNTYDQSLRLNMLEYTSSETEREKRILQAVITHPNIDINSENLADHIKQFFSETLKMTSREIDSALKVNKIGKPNTVLMTFSSKVFKLFVYSAKKKLRQTDVELVNNFFINDNLTHFNYSLMKLLKAKKKLLSDKHPKITIFSLEGKVFARLDNDSDKIHIKNREICRKIIESISSERVNLPGSSNQ